MSLFRFQYLVFIISILIISILFICLLELKEQFRYNYIQYQSASINNVNILSYKLRSNIHFFKTKILNKKDKQHLPRVNIYISKNSLNYFKDRSPDSNKNWQRALLKNKIDKQDINISIRPRGDNPANWALNKKSWKLKIRKNNFKGGTRTFAYVMPRVNENLGIDFYSSYLISKKLGLLTPNIRFVELYLNGIYQGYYYEIEETDENFLRNNNLMPVNIYKGENYYVDFKVDIADNLFNNSSLWTKKSTFNQRKRDNKDDLDLHLKQLKSFENRSISEEILFNYFPLKKWAKEFLSGGNNHTTNLHNQRLMIDEWSGEATRIMHDPDDERSVINGIINVANDEIEKVISLDPLFNYTKLKYHYEYFKEKKILLDVSKEIGNIKEQLINSIYNDFHYKYFSKIKTKKQINSIIDNYLDQLRSSSQNINYERKIDATWNFSDKNLNVNINDNLPIGKIKVKFKNKVKIKNLNVILETNNKFHKIQSIPYKIVNNEIILDAVLLADRIRSSQYEINRIKCCVSNNIAIRPTKFSFSLNDKLNFSQISEVYVENIFTKKYQKIYYSKNNGYNLSSFNYAILKFKEKNPKVFFGDIYFKNKKKNIIINKETIIKPGTKFFLDEGTSIIFKKKVIFDGTLDKPIIFQSINENKPWGVVAIVGKKTEGSQIKFTKFNNGTGGKIYNYLFTGMLSIHNTSKIKIENIHLINNRKFDDMMHVVYVNDLEIINSKFLHSEADAIDIDSSNNVKIQNIEIRNAGNDCLDFMQTSAVVNQSKFSSCKDKGISIGERSNIKINESKIDKSDIGVVSKDDSLAILNNSLILNNRLGLSAFKKNWRYGNGGTIKLENVMLDNNEYKVKSDQYSNINFYE